MPRVYVRKIPPKECESCGNEFFRHQKMSRKQWADTRFCSMECSRIWKLENPPKPEMSLEEKFRQFFDPSQEGCWEWTGTKGSYGYGVMYYERKQYRAHVLALFFDGRPVPKGMVARHHCDNPICVRPDHLTPGTAKQNAHDAMRRNRLLTGEKNKNSVLTADIVKEARKRFASGQRNYAALARRYNVSRPTITRAIRGETWRSVK